MPRENFYNPDAAAGTPGERFAVEWDPNHNYAVPGSDTDEGVLVLAGVYMDVSAVERLQSVLRRALRKYDARNAGVTYRVVMKDGNATTTVPNVVNLDYRSDPHGFLFMNQADGSTTSFHSRDVFGFRQIVD